MPIRLGRFEMPRRLVRDEATATEGYAKFFAEPLEPGYGRTLGNSLRRVLLSSLEGAAASSVKIEGAPHEFCALPGVVEDVTDIILNLKNVLFRMKGRGLETVRIKVKGPKDVVAGDIEVNSNVEILNPKCHIATLGDDGKLEAELEVRIGRGFCHAEGNKKEEQVIGVIPMDSVFSPVKRVNFDIESTRVGQRIDYDKLVLEVWTDGRLVPNEALRTAAAILRHHLDVFVNYDEDVVEFEEGVKQLDEEREALRRKLNMSVNEIEMSVRAANCLNNANITTVGQLSMKQESEMLQYRNFGRKSLKEIKDKLSGLGLGFGMAFDPDLLKPPDETEPATG